MNVPESMNLYHQSSFNSLQIQLLRITKTLWGLKHLQGIAYNNDKQESQVESRRDNFNFQHPLIQSIGWELQALSGCSPG